MNKTNNEKWYIKNNRWFIAIFLILLALIKSYFFRFNAVEILDKTYKTSIVVELITISSIVILISTIKTEKYYKLSLYLFSFFTAFLYVSNLIYAKNFGDLLGSLVLFQANQVGDVTSSILGDFSIGYIIFILDILFVYIVTRNMKLGEPLFVLKKRYIIPLILTVFVCNIVFTAASLKINARSWNMKPAMQMGLLTYHLAELPASLYKINFPEKETEEDKMIFELNKNEKVVDNDLKGILKDKNIVFLQWETLSKYGLMMNIDGQDVMPNLKNIYENSYHNERFYTTVATGHSSDTEFLTLQSMYNYNDKAVSVMESDKNLNSIIHLLKENDYHSFSMHNFTGNFWNRSNMHKAFGFDESIFLKDTLVQEDGLFAWGYSDRVLYNEAHNKINQVYSDYGKFISYLITVQNHTPFKLENPELYTVPYESSIKKKNMNNYFSSLKETDAYFGEFMESIKNEEWYNDTVFVIYADHDLELEEEDLFALLNQEDYKYTDTMSHELVPFMIYSPTVNMSQFNEEYSQLDMSHLDITPTLLQLLDLKTKGYSFYGQNIFDKNQKHTSYHVQGTMFYDDFLYDIADYPNKLSYKKVNRYTNEPVLLTEDDYLLIDKTIKEVNSSHNILNNNLIVDDFLIDKSLKKAKE